MLALRSCDSLCRTVEVDHLSFSSIRTFQACPDRFMYRYLLCVPEETVPSNLVFGKALHAAVEHYLQKLLEGETTSLDVLLDVFWHAWNVDAERVRFQLGEDLSTVGRQGDSLLRAFLRSPLARPGGRIIGVEEEMRAGVVPGCPDIVGRLDLLVETDDAVLVVDLKSSRCRWGSAKVAEAAPQLVLYGELVKPLAAGKPILLSFAVLTKTKHPTLTLHPLTIDAEDVEQTKAMVARVWRAIQTGAFYPNPSGMNCPGCPFRNRPCRAWIG